MNYRKIFPSIYKGLLFSYFLDFKKTIKVSSIVVITIAFFDFGMVTMFLRFNEDVTNDISGILFFGTIAMIIAFSIYSVISTSKDKMSEKFSFPINRKVFAITNFLFSVLGSFGLLAVLTLLAPIEVLLYKFVDLTTDKFMYVNLITVDSFIIGFISAWAIMIGIGSLSYSIAIFIREYTYYTISILVVLLASLFMFGWFEEVLKFVFSEDTLILFVLKLIVFSLIFHGIGYVALKHKEVH